MDTFPLRIFQTHLLDQCSFLLLATNDLNFGLQTQDSTRIWYGIQNILNAGANISKMLWGQKGSQAESRKPLRDSIGIGDKSPLREVTMRNHFEHIDERIDRWWAESERHNHADKLVGPTNLIVGMDETDMFRWFDPTSKDIIFWGQRFNLQDIVSEVQRIVPRLQEEAAKLHWSA